jgi:hypothetical protein
MKRGRVRESGKFFMLVRQEAGVARISQKKRAPQGPENAGDYFVVT